MQQELIKVIIHKENNNSNKISQYQRTSADKELRERMGIHAK